ncbi:MAG TPA: zf-HC2 domain-containing protein [Bryobacteraceae bacterium]|nr:zf-HC2 domain-containing protein [Bryobacteraceae bacterium]
MTCSLDDLKAYAVGELTRREQTALEDHVRACGSCREELERLNLMRSALATLEEEELPRRIAFVSDRVFEPRWWQTMWRSGPAMGFASAALLAGAILAHGFVRPVAQGPAAVDTAQIEQRVESQVNARLDAAVAKAVAVSEARQSAEFDKTLKAVETRFQSQLQAQSATVQQAADYYREKMAQFLVASNEGSAR